MGCGCKNNSEFVVSDGNTNSSTYTIVGKKDFTEKFGDFLLRKNKFSIFGIFLFFIITPVTLAFMIPIVIIFLFNKLIFGKDTNPVNLIAFSKDKSYKNFKKIKK
jgi:hypothetical protein